MLNNISGINRTPAFKALLMRKSYVIPGMLNQQNFKYLENLDNTEKLPESVKEQFYKVTESSYAKYLHELTESDPNDEYLGTEEYQGEDGRNYRWAEGIQSEIDLKEMFVINSIASYSITYKDSHDDEGMTSYPKKVLEKHLKKRFLSEYGIVLHEVDDRCLELKK